ncbi:MAG: PEP-CTERM sorting domain-containing protein [Bryobacteraceae bacterium]
MRASFALSLFIILFVAVSGAWGGAITIQNPSFESPSCGTSGPAYCAPADWVLTDSIPADGGGDAEAFMPEAGVWNSIPNGSQVGYSNGPGDSLSQVLTGNSVVANTTYTLSVWVSEQGDIPSTFSPVIELLAGSYTLIDLTAANPEGNVAPTQPGGAGTPYTWVDWTGTYTSGASGGAIGQTLKIYLSAGGIQTDYDELSLNASPDSPGGVPEPAVFALVGAGLLGLVTRRRFAK